MYFFYFDESGNRDPKCSVKLVDGSIEQRDPLYVLTAIGLYERKWHRFDRAIANLKLEFSDHIARKHGPKYTLAECEVKSTTLRIPKRREAESPFLAALCEADRRRIGDTFYQQIVAQQMVLFSVVIDKRKLQPHMTAELLHKKAYELCLERIEHYLWEYHPNHQGLVIMDDTQRQLNHAVAMKHAYFQREGNRNVSFHHIVEYPFFTDSKLSNGVQLADLCAYNVYRAFRAKDFSYPFFANLLPNFYCSKKTATDKLDGLKVFPDDSELVAFSMKGFREWQKAKTTKPAA
jgi:hypothetical protein